MPSKNYALEPDGPERVGVVWEGAFKDLSVTFDGTTLGSFETAKDLETPRAFPLPDGSRLEIVLAKSFPVPELRLSRDGEPLPGSAGDPQTQLNGAATVLLAIAALNLFFGLMTVVLDITFLKQIGLGWGSVITGLVYAGLSVLVKKRSTAALAVAVALFVLDGVFMLLAAAEAKASPPIGGMIARIIFLLPMLRGFGAIRELNKPRKPKRTRPAVAPGASRTIAPRPAPPALGGSPRPPTAAPVGGEPSASVVTSIAPPLSPPPAVKVLAGDAEKLRLKLSEKNTNSPAVSATGRKVDTVGPASVDAARKSLRFIAHRCEVGESCLRATLTSGEVREIAYEAVVGVVARQLPPDPPWDGAFLIDIVPSPEASPEPVRIFGNTFVNYAAIPGGSTNRLDNTRRLTAFLRDRCPNAILDEATQEFVRGPKVPQRFANMTQFIEYDSRYG